MKFIVAAHNFFNISKDSKMFFYVKPHERINFLELKVRAAAILEL